MGKGKGTTAALVYETVPVSALFVSHKSLSVEMELEDKEKGVIVEEEAKIEVEEIQAVDTIFVEQEPFFEIEEEEDLDYVYDDDERPEQWESTLYSRKHNSYSRVSRDKKHEKVNPDRFVRSWKQNQEALRSSRIISNYPRGVQPSFSSFGCHRGEYVSSSTKTTNWRPTTDREADELNRAIIESATVYNQTLDIGLSQQQIQDLLSRDLTPEDYELLLMLDKSVAPKTVEEEKLASFTARTVDSSPEFKDRCAVCMCDYEEGENVLVLPCKHMFHKDCIEQWLTKSSKNCPIDNLPV